ncbi:MAG: porphobilinogen synthase [Alphaproteobacteria bacterium]|nr:porphobilinogen synthase [Alphaproteobacteria bacterium]
MRSFMTIHGTFPNTRLRRNRKAPWIRSLVEEHQIRSCDLILPLFVTEGQQLSEPVKSLPGVNRLSIDQAIITCQRAAERGIKAIALFPVVPLAKKTDDAKEALNPDNLLCQAIAAIKAAVPTLGIITDIALDPYTSHGHDGLLVNGDIANDATVHILCQQAIIQAAAGADIVAPSDMMDGRIRAIRQKLDIHGYQDVSILSYAVKYASSFYGPFRDAVGSATNIGKSGKHTYQMDPANSKEALREAALDIEEGADMLMVKPGLPYLDIIKVVSDTFPLPVFAYQVSGEYAMIKAAAANGWIDGDQVMLESLLAFKRAGARAILTYAALDIAAKLGNI